MSTSPEYDTIDLPANTTIVITQPLEITHSVKIVGNNATLLFQQGRHGGLAGDGVGRDLRRRAGLHQHPARAPDFTIKFDMSAPIRWSNPPGAEPALFDPENNPAGIQHAVIDTRDSNTNLNMTLLTLEQHGRSTVRRRSMARRIRSLQAQLAQTGDTTHQYVGEQDIDLVRTNDEDSGTIASSTFQGGSIEVFGGPVDHHRQHGPGIDGRYLFARRVRACTRRTTSCSRATR